jgi:predicted Zn-dependent peptidase
MVDGIRVHVLPTDRFKTFAISIYIGQPLREDTVTLNALTPFVLRRGTASFPETIRFRERLDDLYGAGFGFDIYKRGDYQIVQFRMDVIHDEFVKENGSLLEQSLAFLGETLTKPALENGRFLAKYVSSEKVTLQKRLESIINDKIRYAAERCIEEMCKDEPYRLHPLGKIEAIEPIDAEQLYHSYLRWLNESPIDIYVVGNTTFEEVSRFIRQSFDLNPSQRFAYQKTVANRPVREVKRVVERMEVGQGKLNM